MIRYIDEVEIKNKRVLLRVDFNVSLNPDHTIANDTRILKSIPTIKHLLGNNNKLVLVSHLGRPKARDVGCSLRPVIQDLQKYLPGMILTLVDDFLSEDGKRALSEQKENEVMVLENIRFYPEEKVNNPTFAKSLSELAEVYVNDAFAVDNRTHCSTVGITQYVLSYGGLLLKKEVNTISQAINQPKKPFVAIIGGAKISDKMELIWKLTEVADHLIVGGGLANTFLAAQGFNVGASLVDTSQLDKVRRLFFFAAEKNTVIQLPMDVVVGKMDETTSITKNISEVPSDMQILDIGPDTQAKYGALIAEAKTIVWNGPVGYFENPVFKRGTDFIYYAIAHNSDAISIVGGGDTLSAISNKEYLDKITHISTGGGAMLEFIEKGTLPGIEALEK